ncbi:MAG: hypothetical protein ACXVDW_15725 [Bacteroidia bacterium]
MKKILLLSNCLKSAITILLFALLFINVNQVRGQVAAPKDNSDVGKSKVDFCGATPEYAKKMYDARTSLMNSQPNTQSEPYRSFRLQNTFPADSIVRCGMFRVYYDDFEYSADGFNDPAQGANRRNTMCAVLSYIQSVIKINDTIDIFVSRSFSAANPFTTLAGTLAFAGSENPPGWTTTPGIYNGYAYDHITTGTDPNINTYDLDVTVNFHQYYNSSYGIFFPVQYYDNYASLPAGDCRFDLFSVLLHEITHGMGWASMVAESTAAGRPAINGNSGSTFTNAFSRFDNIFLYRGNILTGTFTKLVDNTPQIDPAINASGPDPLRGNNIWLYNNAAPLNQPMYSGDFYGNPVAAASLVSHLNFNFYSLDGMSQYSPGYQPKYVMGPFFDKNEMRRAWTLPEMRGLLALGYSLNPVFASTISLDAAGTETNNTLLTVNTPAYRTDPATIVASPDGVALVAEAPTFNATLVNNNTPTSLTLSQLTVNIGSLLVADNEGNPISMMPNSLFGIRGVTSGGNNHNCLAVSGAGGGTTVVYTPVPGFNGIAQFGFYLWDGHERGAFKTYTINVTRGSYAPVAGVDLAVNGNFEDGTEVRDTTVANLSKPYSSFMPNQEGEYFAGIHFSGGHPYNFIQNWWTWGGGQIVINTFLGCGAYINPPVFPYFGEPNGNCNQSGFGGFHPLPKIGPGTNQRYMKNQNGSLGDPYFINLKDTIKQYKYYVVDMDVAFSNTMSWPNHDGDPFSINFEFTGNPVIGPAVLAVYQSTSINGTIDSALTGDQQRRWQHVRDTIQYCQANPCYTVAFQTNKFQSYVDNFSIVEMINPPLLTAVDATTPDPNHICPGAPIHLHAQPNSTSCDIVYSWAPGPISGQNIIVNPLVTTTYTVTATDLLDTTHHVTDTITIFVDPINTVATATSYTICAGGSTTITATGATTYSWSPGGATSASITVNPIVTTSYIVTGSDGTCTMKDTVTITVNPLQNAAFTYGASSYCQSGSTNPTPTITGVAGGTFSAIPSGLSINSSTGQINLAGSTIGAYTVTYTTPGPCANTATFSVTITSGSVATFSYALSTYCKTGVNPLPTFSGGGTAGTFSASPGGLSINASTGLITLSTSTAGTYTVTNTVAASGGCASSSASTTVTIINPPVATFSYAGSPYCPGVTNPSPIFSGGGVAGTFTSAPAGLSINASTGVINLAASGSGTYTVTNTIPASGGCAAVTASTSITVINFTVIAAASSTAICSGDMVTLSVGGAPSGSTITWSPGGSTTVFPTSTTTYTVTVTKSGCTATSSVTVNVTTGCCTAPPTHTTVPPAGATSASYPTGFVGDPIAINGNFTVTTGTFNMTAINNVLLAPNVTITVNSGATLIIDKCRLYTCSNQMWDGIVIQPGGMLILRNGTRIEDAKVAVLSDNSGGIANFLIDDNTLFNRNYTAVRIINYSSASAHPGIIRNTTFDSQPWSPPYETAVTGTLDAPYNTQTAQIGIELVKSGLVQIGDPSFTVYQNKFRYLRIGIRADGSNYIAYNNDFRNNYITVPCVSCSIAGWAIYNTNTKAIIGGPGTTATPYQPNNFQDLGNGILHENGYYLDVLNNSFNNIVTGSGILGTLVHSVDVFTRNWSQSFPNTITIKNNSFKNMETGLEHQNCYLTRYLAQTNTFKIFNNRAVYCVQNSIGDIQILQNSLNEAPATMPDSGSVGIEVANAVITGSPTVSINNNLIYKVRTGISVTDIIAPKIKNNNIGFKNAVSLPGSYCGIKSKTCKGDSIYQNVVYKSTNPTSAYENYVYGISVETNQSLASVTENNVQRVGRGLRFYNDPTANLTVRCNIMTNNWAGLTIDGSNIGSQGASTVASPPNGDAGDNNWSTIPSTMTGSVSVRGLGAYTAVDFYTRAGVLGTGSYPWCPSGASIVPVF